MEKKFSQKKTRKLEVRLSVSELEEVRKRAQRLGLTVSSFVRMLIASVSKIEEV